MQFIKQMNTVAGKTIRMILAKQILILRAKGVSRKRIAPILSVSKRTVEEFVEALSISQGACVVENTFMFLFWPSIIKKRPYILANTDVLKFITQSMKKIKKPHFQKNWKILHAQQGVVQKVMISV